MERLNLSAENVDAIRHLREFNNAVSVFVVPMDINKTKKKNKRVTLGSLKSPKMMGSLKSPKMMGSLKSPKIMALKMDVDDEDKNKSVQSSSENERDSSDMETIECENKPSSSTMDTSTMDKNVDEMSTDIDSSSCNVSKLKGSVSYTVKTFPLRSPETGTFLQAMDTTQKDAVTVGKDESVGETVQKNLEIFQEDKGLGTVQMEGGIFQKNGETLQSQTVGGSLGTVQTSGVGFQKDRGSVWTVQKDGESVGTVQENGETVQTSGVVFQKDRGIVWTVQKDGKSVGTVQKDGKSVGTVQKDGKNVGTVQKDGKSVGTVQKDGESMGTVQKDGKSVGTVQTSGVGFQKDRGNIGTVQNEGGTFENDGKTVQNNEVGFQKDAESMGTVHTSGDGFQKDAESIGTVEMNGGTVQHPQSGKVIDQTPQNKLVTISPTFNNCDEERKSPITSETNQTQPNQKYNLRKMKPVTTRYLSPSGDGGGVRRERRGGPNVKRRTSLKITFPSEIDEGMENSLLNVMCELARMHQCEVVMQKRGDKVTIEKPTQNLQCNLRGDKEYKRSIAKPIEYLRGDKVTIEKRIENLRGGKLSFENSQGDKVTIEKLTENLRGDKELKRSIEKPIENLQGHKVSIEKPTESLNSPPMISQASNGRLATSNNIQSPLINTCNIQYPLVNTCNIQSPILLTNQRRYIKTYNIIANQSRNARPGSQSILRQQGTRTKQKQLQNAQVYNSEQHKRLRNAEGRILEPQNAACTSAETTSLETLQDQLIRMGSKLSIPTQGAQVSLDAMYPQVIMKT